MIDRPSWADSLTAAMTGLVQQGPVPLLPILNVFAQTKLTEQDLGAFIDGASENDPALIQLRLTLAAWDSADKPGFDPNGTDPRSQARREHLYELMGIGSPLRESLNRRCPVFEVPTTVISRTFEPWYHRSRAERSSMYWNHYEAYLRDTKGWPAESIMSLDETTTDVVERLSDPTRSSARKAKGLVVGYVQSGKTANFTGVMAKAIDAGYRLVIVLTGTIEPLRAQTQRRIDMELIGRENILDGLDPNDPQVARELDYQEDEDWIRDRFIRHGAELDQPNVVHIRRVTTHHSDYKRLPQGLTRLRFHRYDKSKPLNDPDNLFRLDAYVAIVKKNRAPLSKLIQDLTPIRNQLGELPALIIDDESDQASVDTTNPKKYAGQSSDERKRTAINKLISDLLHLCPRAQYVGYTATPFANVFIDPDDERNLFPSDFLLSLHRPPGYMGVQEFHDVGKRWDDEEKTLINSNELAHVRSLRGAGDLDPRRREEELQEALDAWVLSGAIKKYRQAVSRRRYRHHTMLVHESVKQLTHSETATDIRRIWNSSQFVSAGGLARLETLWGKDFDPVMRARADNDAVPPDFAALRRYIAEAYAAMTVDGDPVLIVNSDKQVADQQRKLDFDKDEVWRILVGGTQLSRGFTVEGLTISYFRRKTLQADTLMQAGRWFGFRSGFEDLVRLYIRRDDTVDLYDAFEALLLDEEAFRDELRQYEGFDDDGMPIIEPRQIPPLVSQHLPWLRPTARNKMWNAVIESKATALQFQDFYGLPPHGDIAALESNLNTVGLPLLDCTSESANLSYQLADGAAGNIEVRCGLLDAVEARSLFTKMQWHPEYQKRVDPVMKFITNAVNDGRLKDWLVVWPQASKGAEIITLAGLNPRPAPVITRRRRQGRIDFIGSDAKHRAAALPAARGQDLANLGASLTRGAILAYLVDDRPVDPVTKTRVGALGDPGSLVVLFSLALPEQATPRKRDLIQWTVRVKEAEAEAAIDKDWVD